MNPTQNDSHNVIAKLAYYPDPHLTQRTKIVTDFTILQPIVDLMYSTMAVNDGIGLAANQIKIDQRLFVMRTDKEKRAFVNPQLLYPSGKREHKERCLSFPGVEISIERYESIVVRYWNLQGEEHYLPLSGLESIVAQHEIDHLDGKTFVDHLGRMKKSLVERKIKKTLKEYQWQQGPKIKASKLSKI